jgi:DNA-binding CsgD family transcriptional regulator
MTYIELNKKYSQLLISILLILLVFIAYDTYVDHKSNVGKVHILLEISLLFSLFAFLIFALKKYIHKNIINEKKLQNLNLRHQELKEKIVQYKTDIHDYLQINFISWKLTKSEKDIALLLFKGCTGKEIAEIRNTNYQTVRSQISRIYRKAKVKNHNQFMATLMEDIL